MAHTTIHWSLKSRGGHWFFLDPAGNPVFLLGVNHIGDGAPEGGAAEAYFDQAAERLREWGYTNFGYGTPAAARGRFPYLQDIQVTRNAHFLPTADFGYEDVFAPAFEQQVSQRVATLCAATASDPYCIGYYWNDTPRWDLDLSRRLRGDDAVSAIRRLGPDAAGKQAYAAFLQNQHADAPSALAQAYGLPEANHDLLAACDFRELDRSQPVVRADDEAFLSEVTARLYRILGEAFRTHAPGKLIFGERYKLGDHPDCVLRAAADWVDAIAIQPGPERGPYPGPGRDELRFPGEALRSIHQITDKPILICDHQLSFPDPDYPHTLWHLCPSEAEAWDRAEAFARAAASEPCVIGYQRCQYRSRPCHWRSGMLKQGLLRTDGTPYPLTAERARRLNQLLQDCADCG